MAEACEKLICLATLYKTLKATVISVRRFYKNVSEFHPVVDLLDLP